MFEGKRVPSAELVVGALGVWLGVQALRTLMLQTVWNTPGEDAPASVMGAVGLAVLSVGLGAWLPRRLVGGKRPTLRFVLLFGAIVLARQSFYGHLPTLLLSWASGVAWLWWLPAFLVDLSSRGRLRLLVPSTVLGLGLLAAGQAALRGLDVPLLAGTAGMVAGGVQVALFLAASFWLDRAPATSVAEGAGDGWGIVAWGPFLFVELSLLVNLGRLEVASDLGAVAASALILAGLLLGLLSLALATPPAVRLGLGVLGVALLLPGLLPPPLAAAGLVLAQVGLVQALLGAFGRAGSAPPGRIYVATAGAALLLIALLMAFYTPYGWPPLWPIAAALVVAAAVRGGRTEVVAQDWWPTGALLAAAVVGLALAVVPSSGPRLDPPRAPSELTVLSYNLFQGLAADATPDMPAIADFVERQNPDVASFYEVNRGWDISAGIEMVAYLQWRFPGYRVLAFPAADPLWANVVMTRYPVLDSGSGLHPPGKGLRRAYGWARLRTPGGDLLYIASHLSDQSQADRQAEVRVLLDLWHGESRTILAGDFNAGPEEPAIRQLEAAGFKDAQAAQGLEHTPTFSALDPRERIDYVLTSDGITSTSAEVPQVLTSDHFPVLVRLRLTP